MDYENKVEFDYGSIEEAFPTCDPGVEPFGSRVMVQIRTPKKATKGGIISFTKTLAAQYVKHNIRANAIAPGSVRTERQIKRYENAQWKSADNPAARERMALRAMAMTD